MFAALFARFLPWRYLIIAGVLAALLAGVWYNGYSTANKRHQAAENERAALAFKEYVKTERENLNLVEQVKVKNEQIKTDSRARIADDRDGVRKLILASAASSVESCASADPDSGSSGQGLAGNQSQTRDSAIAEAIAELSGLAQSCADQTRNVAKTLAEIEAK